MSDFEYIKADISLPMPDDDSQTVDYKCLFSFTYHSDQEGTREVEAIKLEFEIINLQLEITDSVWASFHIHDFERTGKDIPYYSSVEEQLQAAAIKYLEELKNEEDI